MRNKFKKIDIAILVFIFVLIFVCFDIIYAFVFVFDSKERKMVSYEYTTQCRCGGTIEGYHSLVDGFNQEECSKCGYHKEGK